MLIHGAAICIQNFLEHFLLIFVGLEPYSRKNAIQAWPVYSVILVLSCLKLEDLNQVSLVMVVQSRLV